MLIRTANCLYYSDQVNLIDQSYQGWEKHDKDLPLFLVLHVMRTAFGGFQRHCSFVDLFYFNKWKIHRHSFLTHQRLPVEYQTKIVLC